MAPQDDSGTVTVPDDPSQTEGVRVELKPGEDGRAAAPKPVASQESAPPREPVLDDRRLRALENQLAAQRRIMETIQRQLQQAPSAAPQMQPGAQALPAGTPQETVDRYDSLVNDGRWQEAVRLLAREESRAEYQMQQALATHQQLQASRVATWERAMQTVRERYPQLHESTGDPNSPESQLYSEALHQLQAEDPQFNSDPYAAELAMYRMERLARERNTLIHPAAPNGPASTARTPGRAGQTSMPVSRRAGGSSTYTLTKEQKEWCDLHLGHLPEAERYKQYAGIAQVVEQGGNVNG